jgi:hypothetical protein
MPPRVFVALGALALGGCVYGSDVDLAPLERRPLVSPLAEGIYCPVETGPAGQMAAGAADCGRVEWDAGERMLLVREIAEDGADETERVAIAPLGDRLFVVQSDGEDDADGPRYGAMTMLLAPEAMAVLPTLREETYAALARLHPKVTFAANAKTGEPAHIAAGDLPDIDAFLRDAARVAARDVLAEDDLDISVRAEPGAGAAPLSPPQRAAVGQMREAAEVLARGAPRL